MIIHPHTTLSHPPSVYRTNRAPTETPVSCRGGQLTSYPESVAPAERSPAPTLRSAVLLAGQAQPEPFCQRRVHKTNPTYRDEIHQTAVYLLGIDQIISFSQYLFVSSVSKWNIVEYPLAHPRPLNPPTGTSDDPAHLSVPARVCRPPLAEHRLTVVRVASV